MTPLRPEEMSTRRVPTTAISAGRGTEQIEEMASDECSKPGSGGLVTSLQYRADRPSPLS